MKTQVLNGAENKEVKRHYVDMHNSRRLQWNDHRRYSFTF